MRLNAIRCRLDNGDSKSRGLYAHTIILYLLMILMILEAKIVFYNPKDENVADTASIYQMYHGAILVARNEYQFGIMVVR